MEEKKKFTLDEVPADTPCVHETIVKYAITVFATWLFRK